MRSRVGHGRGERGLPSADLRAGDGAHVHLIGTVEQPHRPVPPVHTFRVFLRHFASFHVLSLYGIRRIARTRLQLLSSRQYARLTSVLDADEHLAVKVG
jgi:hypothetical protein